MSIADEIGKLDELRKQGVLTDAEFENQKQALLQDSPSASAAGAPIPPTYTHTSSSNAGGQAEWSSIELKNKWWFQALLGLLIAPVGLTMAMLLESYQRGKLGEARRIPLWFKSLFVTLVAVIWGYSILSFSRNLPDASATVSTCGDDIARSALIDAVGNNAANNVNTLRLLDIENVEEVSFDAAGNVRRCNATLVMNAGRERRGYTLSVTTTGDTLVEIAAGEYSRGPSTIEPPPLADQSEDDPIGRYFDQAGIARREGYAPSELSEFVEALRLGASITEPHIVPLAGSAVEPGLIAILVEIGNTDPGETACHSCDAAITVAWFRVDNGSPSLVNHRRDFDRVGGWGHAPPAFAVLLPDGNPGFAMTVGFTAQGVTELGCRVYELQTADIIFREDLSRTPSSEKLMECG